MPEITTHKYRVLNGHHVIGEKLYGSTSPHGDVFETTQDLSKHNRPGEPLRFALIQQQAPQAIQTAPVEAAPIVEAPQEKSKQDDGLDTQSMGELRIFAKDAGIDILGLNRKDEVIAAIRRAVA